VFTAKDGKCHRCARKITAGEPWTCEHLIAIINGGPNRESNLDVTCGWCLPIKNAADVAEKSRVYRKAAKNIGIRKPSRMKGRGFPKAEPRHTATRPVVRKSDLNSEVGA
jgi:hypothetical protein